AGSVGDGKGSDFLPLAFGGDLLDPVHLGSDLTLPEQHHCYWLCLMQRSVAISTHWMALAWVPGKDRMRGGLWHHRQEKALLFHVSSI
ncbi:unnamed protein product, partial [Durusdinium trenchii]